MTLSLTQTLNTLMQAGVLSLGLAQGAAACAFHSYAPDPTLVDILLGSEHVVLARPDPQNPRKFLAVTALAGLVDGVEIPVPVDGATQARLQANPEAVALFARDGAYGPWLQLAVIDTRYRSVVDTVMKQQSAWALGGDKDRYQLFAALVNDSSPDIRRLALQELDRADYSLLRTLRLPKIVGLKNELESGDVELRPIRILLAGLSGNETLLPFLFDAMDMAARQDVPYLGAYATALIELEGSPAVHHVLTRYLASADLSVATREKIIEALAIHSQTGLRKTQREIRLDLAALLKDSPELAGAVARQFGFRSDWSMADALKRAIADQRPTEIADIFAVNQYIGVASR